MSEALDFLGDIAGHLADFARQEGLPPEEVYVQLTLADGTILTVQGLKPTLSRGSQRWGMFDNIVETDIKALVVREGHVVKAAFQTERPERPRIGFDTEKTA